MRRIHRTSLPKRALGYLKRRQARVDAGQNARAAWESARPTKTVRGVLDVLRGMCGQRQRCMFCEDSRGTQIDHFWPIAAYREKTFLWDNMLLLCDGCNRMKGERFDLDQHGDPFFIDPTAEDPWDYLFYEPRTGIIVARVNPASGAADMKGEHTSDLDVLPLNSDPVTNGRQRTTRALRRAVRRFLERADASSKEASGELLGELHDHDDYGLLLWYFLRDGREESPFSDLRARHPAVWNQVTDTMKRSNSENS